MPWCFWQSVRRAARAPTQRTRGGVTTRQAGLSLPAPHAPPTRQQVHHMAAPEVEERAPHEYEGAGIGRRESLKGDDLPAARHEAPAAGGAPSPATGDAGGAQQPQQ